MVLQVANEGKHWKNKKLYIFEISEEEKQNLNSK